MIFQCDVVLSVTFVCDFFKSVFQNRLRNSDSIYVTRKLYLLSN